VRGSLPTLDLGSLEAETSKAGRASYYDSFPDVGDVSPGWTLHDCAGAPAGWTNGCWDSFGELSNEFLLLVRIKVAQLFND